MLTRSPNRRSQRFNTIARAHLDAAWRVARRCGVSRVEVDDVVQEVFIIVGRRLDEIAEGRERAFVVATTVRVSANWRRALSRRREQSLEDVTPASVGTAHETQEAVASKRQGLLLIDAALRDMTEEQRDVFILTELEQLTAREVAQELEIRETAVVSRLRRARQAFFDFCQRCQLVHDVQSTPIKGATYDV
jgi:RNA polymerase sigma-70 factor, ECF subfamily